MWWAAGEAGRGRWALLSGHLRKRGGRTCPEGGPWQAGPATLLFFSFSRPIPPLLLYSKSLKDKTKNTVTENLNHLVPLRAAGCVPSRWCLLTLCWLKAPSFKAPTDLGSGAPSGPGQLGRALQVSS